MAHGRRAGRVVLRRVGNLYAGDGGWACSGPLSACQFRPGAARGIRPLVGQHEDGLASRYCRIVHDPFRNAGLRNLLVSYRTPQPSRNWARRSSLLGRTAKATAPRSAFRALTPAAGTSVDGSTDRAWLQPRMRSPYDRIAYPRRLSGLTDLPKPIVRCPSLGWNSFPHLPSDLMPMEEKNRASGVSAI